MLEVIRPDLPASDVEIIGFESCQIPHIRVLLINEYILCSNISATKSLGVSIKTQWSSMARHYSCKEREHVEN